jgi:hypothetical protein
MSRPERRVASRVSAFLWWGFCGLLVGVVAVGPFLAALIHNRPDLLLDPTRPTSGIAPLMGVGAIALVAGCFGMVAGFVACKIHTDLPPAGVLLGPLLLKVGGWAVLFAAGTIGVLELAVPHTRQSPVFLALAGTLAGFMAALARLASGLEEPRKKPKRAASSTAGAGQLPHPSTPRDAGGIRISGQVCEGPRP